MQPLATFDANTINTKKLPLIKSGMTIRVHQKIQEGKKTRTQIFEGLVIARKHGNTVGSTITVRKISNGVGVERTFPLYSPSVEKFEVVKTAKVRRAKLYYIREKTAKETRKKTKVISTETAVSENIVASTPEETQEATSESTAEAPQNKDSQEAKTENVAVNEQVKAEAKANPENKV